MESLLGQMIADIDRQRQALEEECRVLNDMLKPWPGRKIMNTDVEEKKVDVETEKKADNLSHEEKQALLQVDELLRKAHKTFNAKTKALYQDENQLSNLSHEKTESCDNSVPKDDGGSRRSDNIENQTDTAKSLSKVNKPPKSSANSLAKGERQTKGPPLGNAAKTKYSQSSGISAKGVERSGGSRLNSYRPPSAQRSVRPSSGKSSHIPAHRSAPFKTYENIKFPKRRSNNSCNTKYISKGSASASSSGLQIGSGVYKTLPSIKRSDVSHSNKSREHKPVNTDMALTENLEENCDISSFNPSDRADGKESFSQSDTSRKSQFVMEGDTYRQDEHNFNQNSASDLESSGDPTQPVESENSYRSASPNQSARTDSPQPDGLGEKPHLFTLKSNGHNLKIPAKLKKPIAMNNSLRERCSSVRLIKKVSSVDAAQKFVDRLIAQEEIGQEMWMHISALTCLRSHQILLDTLQNLNLASLSENSPMEDLNRAKRTLEFVLSCFAESQESSDYLSQVQFRLVQPVMRIWKEEKSLLTFDPDEETTAADVHIGLQDYMHSSSHWSHLKFMEKYLKMHISLTQTAQEEWWKVLTTEKSDPHVLQAVYGILTTGGQFLPALIENPDG